MGDGCGGGSNLVKIFEQLGKSGTLPTLLDNMSSSLDAQFFMTMLSMHAPFRKPLGLTFVLSLQLTIGLNICSLLYGSQLLHFRRNMAAEAGSIGERWWRQQGASKQGPGALQKPAPGLRVLPLPEKREISTCGMYLQSKCFLLLNLILTMNLMKVESLKKIRESS